MALRRLSSRQNRRGDATALAGHEDARMMQAVPTIATIDIGQALDLSEGGRQRVGVIGIAGQASMPSTSRSRLVAATETLTPNS
jgi:hypothetical protein